MCLKRQSFSLCVGALKRCGRAGTAPGQNHVTRGMWQAQQTNRKTVQAKNDRPWPPLVAGVREPPWSKPGKAGRRKEEQVSFENQSGYLTRLDGARTFRRGTLNMCGGERAHRFPQAHLPEPACITKAARKPLTAAWVRTKTRALRPRPYWDTLANVYPTLFVLYSDYNKLH